jgi:putative heme iron utilization protein
MPEMSPEDMAMLTKYKEHQQNAARLSNAAEVRSLVEYSNGYGVLSTNSKQYDGFPTGSVVGYALDDEGYPFMVFSSMSAHTGDVNSDGRVSLTVLAKDFKGAAEGRCVLIGEMAKLDEDKRAAYRDIYMKSHPNAFWIDFGDFTYYKMTSIKAVRFIGGFARAGSLTPEEYLAAKPDPVAAYASHVMQHMNADHSDATAAIVEHYVGVPVKEPSIVGMDSLGMTVKAQIQIGPQGGEAKIRVPWEGGEVTDRKEIKNVIVSMTKASAATAQAAAPAPSA